MIRLPDKEALKKKQQTFVLNKAAISKSNAYILKWMTLIATINMSFLSITSPSLEGFVGAQMLYLVCALLCGIFCLCCFFIIDKNTSYATPLFYVFLAALCVYSTLLSVYYYPNIHGVTVVAMFSLIPVVILDKTWRANAIILCYYVIFSIVTFAFKTSSLAFDDVITTGTLLVFGMIIGTYMRTIRIKSIDQQRVLAAQSELLEYQRDMDVLTGLPNRRNLFENLILLEEDNSSFLSGIIMIDLDDFKAYNDNYGHQAGDTCLKQYGAFFARFADELETPIYRYGGEEFIVLYCSDNPHPIAYVAEKLLIGAREAQKAAPRPALASDSATQTGASKDSASKDSASKASDKSPSFVTISVGYAKRDSKEEVSYERLISMADKALYEAKRLGKNRAVVFDVSFEEKFENIAPSLRRDRRSS